MERWLSKAWVLLGLCAVLLVATFNRRDPMVYFMFLFLSAVTVLGFVIPWLSLRRTMVRLGATGELDVMEGMGCDVPLQLERRSRLPAFMVDFETDWEWAGQKVTLRQTLALVRRGVRTGVAQPVVFPCRGRYRLTAVRLSSGFPLGLLRARHHMAPADLCVRVMPRPQSVHWPLPWRVACDPLGDQTTRHTGPSFELGLMRPYQEGDAVGRVSWRASARAGELIIQHFQQLGSVRLRLVLDAPVSPALADPASAGEQAVRVAAGVCAAAQVHGVHVLLHVQGAVVPLRDAQAIRHALAEAMPTAEPLEQSVARVAGEVVPGEQVALVIACDMAPRRLLAVLVPLRERDCNVVVCIGLPAQREARRDAQALELRMAAEHAGFAVVMEFP